MKAALPVTFFYALALTLSLLASPIPADGLEPPLTLAFQKGESLKYQIKWLGLAIATTRISVDGPLRWQGNNVFRFHGRLKTVGILRRLIKVNDEVTSYSDDLNLNSLRIETSQHEGRYRARRWNVFKNGRASYNRPGRPPRYYELPGPVKDLLGGLYKVRTAKLRPSQKTVIRVFHNKKLYPVRLSVIGLEKTETLWGPLSTLVIKPEFIGNDYLNSFGSAWVYVTADRYRVPVRFESNTWLGPAVVHLIESRGIPSGPLSRAPRRKIENWRGKGKRIKEGKGGGLINLKNIIRKNVSSHYNKKNKRLGENQILQPRPKE